jgi:hypothetical protein
MDGIMDITDKRKKPEPHLLMPLIILIDSDDRLDSLLQLDKLEIEYKIKKPASIKKAVPT